MSGKGRKAVGGMVRKPLHWSLQEPMRNVVAVTVERDRKECV